MEKVIEMAGKENKKDVGEVCPSQKKPICAIEVRSTEQLSKIVKCAEEENVPLFTTYHGKMREDMDYSKGIFLDFSNFKGMERVEADSLVAWVRRGTTFDEVDTELTKYGDVKTLKPLLSSSQYIVENYAMRVPLKAGNRYPEPTFATLHLIVSGGRIFKTGEHALSEEMGDNRDDPGPNLSRWFFGAEDIMGILYLSCIFLFPKGAKRDGIVFKVDEEKAMKAFYEICRKELVQEAMFSDGETLSKLTGKDFGEGKYLIFGWEDPERILEYKKKKTLSIAKEIGLEKRDIEVVDELDKTWTVNSYITSGYLPIKYLKEFYREVRNKEGEIVLSSYSRGGCLTFSAWKENHWTPSLTLSLKKDYTLIERYAVLNGNNNGYTKLLSKIKNMMDEKGIFNPGIYKL